MGVTNAWAGGGIYLKPNDNWKTDKARFAAYFFKSSNNSESQWMSMYASNKSGYYVCAIPDGFDMVILCRMNPNVSDNNWDNKWNQTGNLNVPSDGKIVCSINSGQWDCGNNVTWSAINWYIAGDFNGWNTTANKMPCDISIESGNHTMKIVSEYGDWFGNTGTMIRGNSSGWTMTYGENSNCTLTADVAGTYNFSCTGTKLTVTYPEECLLCGNFVDNWKTTYSIHNKSVTIKNLKAGTYEFKIHRYDATSAYWVSNDGTMTRENCSDWTMYDDVDKNCKITADFDGDYKFTYDRSTGKLSVTYPTAYKVTYGVGTNNGTASVTTEPNITSGSLALPSTSITFSKGATKEGYTWKGWYSKTDGTGTEWGDGTTYTSTDRTGDISVYACYDLKSYSITYNLNGGSGTMTPTSYNIKTETFTLPTPSKTGYTFSGWYTMSDFSDAKVTQIAKGSTGHKEFWAKWTAKTYSITLNGNNGSGHTASVTATYNSATLSPSTITNPTRDGYTFGGWYSASGGTGTMVIGTDGKLQANVSGYTGANGIWIATADKTLYAKWTPITYYVKFNANGGSGSMSNQTFTYGTAQNLTANAFTRTGYTFAGWTTNDDGSGTSYADKASVNNLSTTNGATVNLYAKWTKVHTITLNPNGGTIDDNDWIYDNGTGYYTQTVSEGTVLNLPVATKAGYTNIGWKTDPTTNVVTNPYTVTNNITLIAAYDCALATVGISGTYALTVGDVFKLVATAYDSNDDVLTCPANTTYSWERYNSVDGVWEAITDDNSDGDDAKLTFNNCQIANCGTYRCHITYGDCGAWSLGYNVHCFHLKGTFEGDWNKEYAFNHTDEEGIATLSMDLLTGQTFEFKIYDGITQYGNGGTIETSVTGWTYGADNQSNTIFKTGADGTYIFKLDFKRLINSENILVLDVTYPPANQAEGHTIYYDNLVHNWQNVYYRIGHNRDNGDGTWGWNQNQKMTKVPGTSHLYTTKTPPFDNFEAWHIANNVSWADKNSIYLVNPNGTEYDITHATEYKKFVVVEDITLTPEETGSLNSTDNCTYYPATKQSGMKKHKATVIPATGGTVTVSYTDHDGTAKSDFTSDDRDLAHTCLLTINATPAEGYSLATLSVNGKLFTSGEKHTLTEDATIEATFTINTYTITLDQQGGTGGSESIEVTYDAELPAITVPTREGYTFGGYWTGQNGTGKQYYNQQGTAYRNQEWDIAGPATLYAKWTAHTYTVYFNANGGEGEMADQNFTYDIEQALSANQFTRVGYSFAGWNEKTNGNGNSYADQQVVKNLTATYNGEKTLYAQWAAIHTITWMVNGSQAEGDPTTSVVNGQTITTLPTTPDVDCNGKVFVGWTTATIYGETATIPDPLYTELGNFPAVTSNMTFYAVFANGSGDEHWVETEINDIEATDEVVIAMQTSDKTYAMYINDDATATPGAIVVESSDLTSASGIATGLIWFIEKDGTGKLIIHPKKDIKKNLYCNPSTDNNRVRVGKSHDNHELYKTFEIDGNYLKNSVTLHYIGVNFTHKLWYGYANNSNFSNQTLKFYKKTTVYTSYTNYSTSCMDGVCDITNANPIYVTSAVGQKIKATEKLVLTTTDMAVGTEISLSAPNITFYKEGVEIPKLTTSAASETFELEIAYQPTTANITEQPTITLEILGYQFAFDNKITGRCLPENFVIAAKWGDNWYVLPADMSSETTAEGLLIEVDNPADPTKAIAAPNTTKYSLKSVHTSNQSADRFAEYGERLVFVENVEEATPVAYKTLYNGGGDAQNSSRTNIQVYAQYSGYYNSNPDRYEWIPTTTDLKDYTLTSAHVFTGEVARTISFDNHGVFGTLLQNKSYNGMVRLLPVDEFYTPTELQVVEWKANSVSIMYTGAGTKATTKVGNSESEVQLLSNKNKKIDHAVYTLATSDLTAATNQVLTISIKDDAENTIGTLKLTIPWIVSGPELSTSRVASEVAQATDIVVLDGATLTADDTKYTYNDVVVYPGGKLVIGESGKLGMYSLTLRLGSSWGAAEYEHKYPEFVLNTTTSQAYSNTSGKINLDYVTTKEQYYTFVAPFEVKTKDIKYPVDIYGSNVEAANRGSFEFQYYDGEARANGEKGWKVVAEDPTDGATLTAHQGYTFYGMPKKVSVNGGTSTRQKFGIHRIPMAVAAGTVMSHENSEQNTAVSAYPSEHNINAGWNLIGNPYMSTITGLNNESIQTGTIVLVDDRWQWSAEGTQANRFIVFPSNDGEWYYTSQASNATLPAFKNFFVQIGNENATELSIPRNIPQAQLLAPIRHTDEEVEHDIEMAIVLEKDEAHSDQMDFLINDAYGAGFDYNADFTKMMNNTQLNLYGVLMEDNLSFVALDHFTARGSIAIGYQVPSAGEYTLRISDKPYVMLDKIEALYVTDHEMNPAVTTNLMEEDYVFHVGKAEINDTRFTISLSAKANNDGDDVTTDMGEVDIHNDLPQKFFYDGKLYILREGKVYSATGHEINTINK